MIDFLATMAAINFYAAMLCIVHAFIKKINSLFNRDFKQRKTLNRTVKHVEGYVYIISNPAMPELVKIGYTAKSIESRLSQLNSKTAVAVPFQLVRKYEFESAKNAHEFERFLHRHFDYYRVNSKREFFNKEVLNLLDKKIVLKNLARIEP